MANVYEIVTGKIIDALKAGVVPWRKPWNVGPGQFPHNAFTRRPYRGINAFLLGLAPYSDPRWTTFDQMAKRGGRLRKIDGTDTLEKSTIVTFWKTGKYEAEDPKTGEKIEKNSFMLRYYRVWNVEQIDGLKLPPIDRSAGNEWDAVAEAERIADGMPNPPAVTHAGASDRAFYRPSSDAVTLPARESFDSADGYYSTLFHELGHSTGHESRVNRPGACDPAPFGSETYSQEALVAEFAAAFLTAHSGITNTVENSAAYIASWLKVLRSDPKLAVIAAAQGQKAAEYILGGSDAEATTEEGE